MRSATGMILPDQKWNEDIAEELSGRNILKRRF
jgi:hypothetical protein